MRKYLLSVGCIVLVAFIGIGWFYSDARKFKQVIAANALHSPDSIFHFIEKRFMNKGCRIVHHNATPMHLYTSHKRLFCDEGAALIATFCYYNGYETRFVRVINQQGIDSHTFLQVKEGKHWNSYDFTFNLKNADTPTLQNVSGIKIDHYTYYTYPRLYNKLINANYFLKQAALWLRGIDETDVVN
jgi:hypothetical protein